MKKARIIVILLFLFNCQNRVIINTEVICPEMKILVKFALADDVKRAVNEYHAFKQKHKTTENYTVIRLKDRRSLRIEGIPPEKMIECKFKEAPKGVVDRNYIIMAMNF